MASKEQEFTASFPLDLGIDNASSPTAVQPFGEGGKFVSSLNTRLSADDKVVKCPGAVQLTDATSRSGDSACGGVIPCGYASSNLVIRRPRFGSQRIAGGVLTGANVTRNYWPADVSRSGPVPGTGAYNQPAITTLNGQIWFAHVVLSGGFTWIEVTVVGANGELAASPRTVIGLAGTSVGDVYSAWVGLTSHGANGVRCWYRDTGSTALKMAVLTVDTNGVVSASGTVTVYTSDVAGDQTYDVVRQDDTYARAAVLASLAAGGVTSVTNLKIDTSGTVIRADTMAGVGTAATSRLAISVAALSGGTYVAIVASLVGGTCTLILWSDAGSLIYNVSGVMSYGDPFCGFYRSDTTEYAVFGCSDSVGSITTTFANTAGTVVQFRNLTTGTLANTLTLPWVRAGARMRMFSPAAGEMYPILVGVPFWNKSFTPTDKEFLLDPARNVYMFESHGAATVIGRFGLDRCEESYHSLDVSLHNSGALAVESSKFVLSFLQYVTSSSESGQSGVPLNYVEMDMAARQPPYALAADGTALIAGALPALWDGAQVSEMCPLQQPRITAAGTGGAGDTIAAGTYYMTAFLQWRDAAGTLHRGTPAPTYTLTTGGADKWVVQVSVPATAVRASSTVQVVVCVSVTGTVADTVMYAQPMTPTATSTYVYTYGNVPAPTVSVLHPAVYTDNGPTSPVASQQPPAFWDVAVIRNRAWAILGERRREIWYSKPKEDGITAIGYEWDSDQCITLPAVARKAVKIVEISGSVGILCEGGAWLITGPGPDLTLDNPDAFNAPEQITDLACTSRESVIRTPVGVIFASNTRFAVIGGGGAQLMDDYAVDATNIASAVLLRNTKEAVWLVKSGNHHVYNYQLGRWTQWDTTALPNSVSGAHDPIANAINTCAANASIQQMDPSGSSATAQMSLQTGWCLLGGPEDDNAVEGVYVRCQKNGTHGLTVTLESEFGRDTKTKVFSSAAIDACVVGDEYTVCVSPPTPSMRSLRITIQETSATGDACRPLVATVVGVKNRAPMRSSVRPQGRG